VKRSYSKILRNRKQRIERRLAGAHHPMGPLELADFIGLDTCLSIMQVLYEGLGDSKYRPCPLLVKYVEAGWLGRKTQRGFYDYRTDPPTPTR
jgi:3-hydroxybutyryl-CoA dehydrogenase